MSFCRQSVSQHRSLKERGVDSDSRAEKQHARKKQLSDEKDNISKWSDLKAFCEKLDGILFSQGSDNIQLIEMSGIPPVHIFSVIIYDDFRVECYKSGYCAPIRDLVGGFSAKLEKFSQLHSILDRVRTYELSTTDIAKSFGNDLQALIENSKTDEELTYRVLFLAEQLKLVSDDAHSNRYAQSPISFRTAINLYLRSRSCYNELRKSLSLPHPKTIKSCFGKSGTPGSIDECTKTVNKVFSNLEGNQLFTKIMVDEIHITPSIRYRRNHLIGQSIDQPDKVARTVLGLMISTMYGGPSFMARLLPIYTLDSDILFEQIQWLIRIIHDSNGFVFLVLSDDLRANQKTYKLFHKNYGSQGIFDVDHPISNPVFTKLYLLHDPTHLFKE